MVCIIHFIKEHRESANFTHMELHTQESAHPHRYRTQTCANQNVLKNERDQEASPPLDLVEGDLLEEEEINTNKINKISRQQINCRHQNTRKTNEGK